MILINGRPDGAFDIADRGLHYGDGVFETLDCHGGRLAFLAEHLQRLENGCNRLLIPAPDAAALAAEARLAAGERDRAVIKIVVTRGSGGRGYRPPEAVNPTRIVLAYPHPQHPAHYREHGVNVRLCRTRLSSNPALAGIKHLNRLEQVLARAEWQDDDIQEGLMLDGCGRVVEGCMSNLFFVKQGALHTAQLQHCGVAGIVRAWVLRQAAQLGLPCLTGDFTPEQLFGADELFLTNSVIGIWPVKRLEGQAFSAGPVTAALQRHYAEQFRASLSHG